MAATLNCLFHPDVPISSVQRCWKCYRDGAPVDCPNCTKPVLMPKGIEAGVICPHCDSRVYAPGKVTSRKG